MAYISKV